MAPSERLDCLKPSRAASSAPGSWVESRGRVHQNLAPRCRAWLALAHGTLVIRLPSRYAGFACNDSPRVGRNQCSFEFDDGDGR